MKKVNVDGKELLVLYCEPLANMAEKWKFQRSRAEKYAARLGMIKMEGGGVEYAGLHIF